MAAKATPDGYHSLTPYITVRGGEAAIAFYEKAFGAKLILKLTMPGGGIAHAEMKIGDSPFMFGDENPDWGNKSPLTLGGTPTGMMIYVADCDEAFAQAVAAGATVDKPLEDQFYGDRSGTVVDPSGHKWTLGTHQKDMTEAEMQKAMDAMMQSMAPPA